MVHHFDQGVLFPYRFCNRDVQLCNVQCVKLIAFIHTTSEIISFEVKNLFAVHSLKASAKVCSIT
ncbi:MAG: hypothetical protein CMIDDMOC_00420 [Sodalis sp. Fle]|nr:MAG: hypothetical protein CMIDDMOC_00420 [Sodalis sp. Fle]